jgi:hypothetical protein
MTRLGCCAPLCYSYERARTGAHRGRLAAAWLANSGNDIGGRICSNVEKHVFLSPFESSMRLLVTVFTFVLGDLAVTNLAIVHITRKLEYVCVVALLPSPCLIFPISLLCFLERESKLTRTATNEISFAGCLDMKKKKKKRSFSIKHMVDSS